MRLAALGFAAGAAWLQFQPVLPGGNGRLVLVVLMLLAAASAQPAGKRLGGQVRLVLIALAFVFAGALLATFIAQAGLDDRLAPEWEGRRITLVGVVSDLPQPGDRSLRFDFDVESAIPPEAHVPSRVRLSWFNGLDKTEFETLQPMRAGERWRLPVTLKRAHGGVNRDGFDYEAYLFERGIRATGTVNAAGAGEIERLDPKAGGIGHAIDRLRESVRERYWDSAGDRPLTGVLVALAIGEQRAIEPADWDVFARTGTAHLMSISGLHVTMVAGLFAWVVGFAWRRIPPLALSLPAQKAAATAGFVAAFGYCLLAGFAVPAQRTLYMLGVVAAARLFGRDTSASHTLAAAMLVVLLLDPMAVVSPGFWLSFGAVAAIFYAGPRSMLPRPWWSEWGRMQWAVTIALVPMSLVFFQQVSLVSPLANAIAIPVVSWIVTPLALLAAVLPAGPMLGAAHAVLEPLIVFLGVLSAFDSAQWTQHAPPLWSVALALAGLAWLLAPRGIPARSLGAVLCLPMIALPPAAPAHGELQLTMLDVGQGLAVLARTSHHTLLFDTGPSWGQDSDSGKRVVVAPRCGGGVPRRQRSRRRRPFGAWCAAHGNCVDGDRASRRPGGRRALPAALSRRTALVVGRGGGPVRAPRSGDARQSLRQYQQPELRAACGRTRRYRAFYSGHRAAGGAGNRPRARVGTSCRCSAGAASRRGGVLVAGVRAGGGAALCAGIGRLPEPLRTSARRGGAPL